MEERVAEATDRGEGSKGIDNSVSPERYREGRDTGRNCGRLGSLHDHGREA